MREGPGVAPARISSPSVWTKTGRNVDKNKGWCMMDKIGHVPNLVRYYEAYPGVLLPKSGIMFKEQSERMLTF